MGLRGSSGPSKSTMFVSGLDFSLVLGIEGRVSSRSVIDSLAASVSMDTFVEAVVDAGEWEALEVIRAWIRTRRVQQLRVSRDENEES